MTDDYLYHAAEMGNLPRVARLVEQGADKADTIGGRHGGTILAATAENNHIAVVQYLVVEQGADIEKEDRYGWTPLINASSAGHLGVTRYLLEQGANRDKVSNSGYSSLHWAALKGHLEIAKLLMSYGADLTVRDNYGDLPIDFACTEDIKQAIRDEPRRRMDHGFKRMTEEQDQHPPHAVTAVSVIAQQGEVKKDCSAAVEEDDDDSELSDQEDD